MYKHMYMECKEKVICKHIENFIKVTGGDSLQVNIIGKEEAYTPLDSTMEYTIKSYRRKSYE